MTENNPAIPPTTDEQTEWLMEAIEAVHNVWSRFRDTTEPVSQAARLVELNDAIFDLITYHPTWDFESGTLGWERTDDDTDTYFGGVTEWEPTHYSPQDESVPQVKASMDFKNFTEDPALLWDTLAAGGLSFDVGVVPEDRCVPFIDHHVTPHVGCPLR